MIAAKRHSIFSCVTGDRSAAFVEHFAIWVNQHGCIGAPRFHENVGLFVLFIRYKGQFWALPVNAVFALQIGQHATLQPAALLPSDFVLDPTTADHASTNLNTKSIVRLHKLATIYSHNVVQHLGSLSPMLASEVDGKIRALLNP